MLNVLAATTDKLQLTTSAAADVDVVVIYIDCSDASPPVASPPNRQVTAITTATTTDILAAPASSTRRIVKAINIVNKDAADTTNVTPIYDANGTDYTLFPATSLAPGEALTWTEDTGWFKYENEGRLDKLLVVTADVVNATTSWADVTGLTHAVEAGKTYIFLAHLLYITNATTTGARFGVNGPAVTYLRGSGLGTVTGSVTAAAVSAPTAAVNAVDTSMIGAQTTGPATEVWGVISGTYVPSAAGTFAVRCQSEVAVAAGLTVRRGSWCLLREADNT